MAVKLIGESGSSLTKFGVLTDASDEKQFIRELAACICTLVTTKSFGEPNTYESDIDQYISVASSKSEEPIEIILERSFEIILKLKGYKSSAKERKETYCGDSFPSMSEISYSSGHEYEFSSGKENGISQ